MVNRNILNVKIEFKDNNCNNMIQCDNCGKSINGRYYNTPGGVFCCECYESKKKRKIKSKGIDSEKLVERRLVELIHINNGMCIKLSSMHLIGLPDRLCLLPKAKIAFVELKTTNKKPTKIQVFVHGKLRALGFRVEILDTVEGVYKFIDNLILNR